MENKEFHNMLNRIYSDFFILVRTILMGESSFDERKLCCEIADSIHNFPEFDKTSELLLIELKGYHDDLIEVLNQNRLHLDPLYFMYKEQEQVIKDFLDQQGMV